MHKIVSLYNRFLWAINAVSPLFMLVVRIWIAHVFWNSGLVKISDWGSTLFLFSNEYAVPLLPPMIAAVFATVFELSCSVLLTVGLGARLATLPLLAMTAVIEFTYQDNVEHYCWAMLLGAILFFGPGKLSIDHLIKKIVTKKGA